MMFRTSGGIIVTYYFGGHNYTVVCDEGYFTHEPEQSCLAGGVWSNISLCLKDEFCELSHSYLSCSEINSCAETY